MNNPVHIHWFVILPLSYPSCFIGFCLFLYHSHTALIITALSRTHFISGKIRLPPLPYSPLYCSSELFGLSWDFTLHKNFSINLFRSTKKSVGILIELAFEIVGHFGENWQLYSIFSFMNTTNPDFLSCPLKYLWIFSVKVLYIFH